MTPRPNEEIRAEGRARIAELKKKRDLIHAEAEAAKAAADQEMWTQIVAELDGDQVIQDDIVKATGFSRDHVLRRTKKIRNA